jgi:hypothetical protein
MLRLMTKVMRVGYATRIGRMWRNRDYKNRKTEKEQNGRPKCRTEYQSVAVHRLIPWRGSLAVSAMISVQQFHRPVRNTARNSEISAGDWSCIGSVDELTNYFRSTPRHADAFSQNNATTFFQNHSVNAAKLNNLASDYIHIIYTDLISS